MEKTDKEMMNYLVKYVIGNPFPHKHTVMDVDDVYGIRVFSPTQILESSKGPKKNTRFIITFQSTANCKIFASPGFWKPAPKIKSIFYANKRHIGNIKIFWYHYYNRDPDDTHKSTSRLRKNYAISTDHKAAFNSIIHKAAFITMIPHLNTLRNLYNAFNLTLSEKNRLEFCFLLKN